MKPKPFLVACMLACLISSTAFTQCLPVTTDTSACTGSEPLVVNNEIIGAGTTKWFYGAATTFNSIRIQAGGKLVVCGNLQVNDFGMQGGTLVITRTGRLTVNTGSGASMVFNGGCSIYNLGFFKIWCNLVLDGPDAWTNPVQPNIVWNGPGATFELSNTYFVLEKGNCFFVNKGISNFSGIITNTLADSASVCLGNMSRMYVSLLENKRRNTYVAPEGPACVFIQNWGFSYEQLTLWPSVFLCRSTTYCMGGCDSIARQNQKWGAASLFNSCNSCAGMYLLPVEFKDVRLKEQGKSMVLSWTVDKIAEQGKFIIQRSKDGVVFQNIDSVELSDERTISLYSYADHSPLQGRSFYRIVFDADNRFTASGVLSANIGNGLGQPKVVTNPVKNECVVEVPDMFVREVKLMSITGSIIYQQKINMKINKLIIPASGFKANGTYVVQIVTKEKSFNLKVLR